MNIAMHDSDNNCVAFAGNQRRFSRRGNALAHRTAVESCTAVALVPSRKNKNTEIVPHTNNNMPPAFDTHKNRKEG